jgi:surfactin synthase thioesterase subunit
MRIPTDGALKRPGYDRSIPGPGGVDMLAVDDGDRARLIGSRVLARPPSRSAAVRLFCLPFAGGGASAYHGWVGALPPAVDVCPVQPPGRETRRDEPPIPALGRLVEALADELLPHLDAPFALFGHSMGGLIGFELARHLRRRHGPSPVRLFVSAHRAPHLPGHERQLHRLPTAALVEELHRLKGTPEAVFRYPELLELVLPVLRADFALCETYRYFPDQPLDCPISAFGGTEDPRVGPALLAAWGFQTRAAFELRLFGGDHFYLRPHQAALLEAIGADLAPHLGPPDHR